MGFLSSNRQNEGKFRKEEECNCFMIVQLVGILCNVSCCLKSGAILIRSGERLEKFDYMKFYCRFREVKRAPSDGWKVFELLIL